LYGNGGPADAGLGGDAGLSTDQLTGDDLAQLASPEDAQVAEMEALLDDPNTPPQVKDQIVQQLDLAARRAYGGLSA